MAALVVLVALPMMVELAALAAKEPKVALVVTLQSLPIQ